jgi:hypothetical protein
VKVAICFFGITRNLKERTLKAMQKNLFAPVAALDPGFVRFGHFNLTRQIYNPRSKEQGVDASDSDYQLLQCDRTATTPQEKVDRQIDFTSFQRYGDPWDDGFASMKNLLRQYYSLEQVTHLLKQSKQNFDLVIYSRADVLYRRPIRIPKVKPGVIYTPHFAKWGGLNDRFALGDQQTMTKYGLRGSAALGYIEKTEQTLHAERFLEWYVQQQELRNEDLDVSFWRVRADGRIASDDGYFRVLHRAYHSLKDAMRQRY